MDRSASSGRSVADVTDPTEVVVVDEHEAWRRCPGCATANHPERLLCATCGVDLETGDELVLEPVRASGSGARTREPSRLARSGTWFRVRTGWLPLVAAVAVTVVVLLGLALAGVGPWAPSAEAPASEFEPEERPGPRVLLEPTDIATVTYAGAAAGRTFVPQNMVDDNASTAWRSDGTSTGEIIELFLDEATLVEMLVIRNGDQLDPDAYASIGRVQQAVVSFDDGSEYLMNLLDQGQTAQAIELPAPALTSTVRIEIVAVYEGEQPGVAISDLELRGRDHPS